MTDEEIDAMSDGDFYYWLLDKDQFVWARQANRKGRLGLNADQEATLSTWFANAQMAAIDRPDAGYIRARLDAEKDEDRRRLIEDVETVDR